MYNYPGISGAGMTIWMIVATAFWVAVAIFVTWALVRLLGRASRATQMHHTPNQPSAAEILKARYARGEIDDTTFRAMMEQLATTNKMATDTQST
jgi:uncharacterized membrane protein